MATYQTPKKIGGEQGLETIFLEYDLDAQQIKSLKKLTEKILKKMGKIVENGKIFDLMSDLLILEERYGAHGLTKKISKKFLDYVKFKIHKHIFLNLETYLTHDKRPDYYTRTAPARAYMRMLYHNNIMGVAGYSAQKWDEWERRYDQRYLEHYWKNKFNKV